MSSRHMTQTVDSPLDWPAARHWLINRILRFSKRQDRERSWINFKDLAERYGRNVSVSEGFKQLQVAILAGEFEQNGRCRVLYLHPVVTKTKMTRAWLTTVTEVYEPATIERQYLGWCWVPREMAIAWCNSRNVSVKAWLDSNAKRPIRRGRQKGWSPIDDSAALEEMRRLIAKFKNNMSHRAAAREVVAGMRMRGNSQDADIDRLRKKLAKGHVR
jgi:hypothetical protein